MVFRKQFVNICIIILSALLMSSLSIAGDPVYEARMVSYKGGEIEFSHGSTIVGLSDGSLMCAWYGGSREKGNDVAIFSSVLASNADSWSPPQVIVDTPGKSEGNPVLFLDRKGVLWLFYQTMYGSGEGPTRPGTGWTTCKVKAITSHDHGLTWSDERILIEELGYLTRNKPLQLENGTILLPIHDERNWLSRILISKDDGANWEMSERIDCGLGFHIGNIEPALLLRNDNSILCYMRSGSDNKKTWQSISSDGGFNWTTPVEIEVPNADAALDLLKLDDGKVLMALNPNPDGHRKLLTLWLSSDDAESWTVFRNMETGPDYSSYPCLIRSKDGLIHMSYSRPKGGIKQVTFNEAWVWEQALISGDYKLPNLVLALDSEDDAELMTNATTYIPVPDQSFAEQIRVPVTNKERSKLKRHFDIKLTLPDVELIPNISSELVTSIVEINGHLWIGTREGLFRQQSGSKKAKRHSHYGHRGPLATEITALVADSHGILYVGTPIGLSVLKIDGTWESIQGRQGLPVEEITALAVDRNDRIWIGTTQGATLYTPYEKGRQWYYRAGKRYLINDRISGIFVAPEGMPVYFNTAKGISKIESVTRTLSEKANRIEKRIDQWHRRLSARRF